MAKQEQNNTPVNKHTFYKGMIKDLNLSFNPKEAWSHARNTVNNSAVGDLNVVGNEPSTLKCSAAPYPIIGTIKKRNDQWFIFSTDDVNSEIGLFDDSTCSYTTIVNSRCLNFKRKNLITGAAKENFDCTWQIYWADGLNPDRTLNVDDIPWIKINTTPPNSTCTTYEDTDELDCERLRLAPLVETPIVTLEKGQDGGLLRNGSYQAFVAYVVNEQKVTDYIGVSNLQSLFDHEQNSGSLTIKLENLDQNFDNYELVILSNNQQNIVAKKVGIYSTQQSRIAIDYIDNTTTTVSFELLFNRNPAYEKSEKMFEVNDYLLRSAPTQQFDFNYQPLANNIITKWVVAEYDKNYYAKGGNKTGLMRDEQYAFFIRWIYNTGDRSASYHIPGRGARANGKNQFLENINEKSIVANQNALRTEAYAFQVYNTATVTSRKREELPDGGVILGKGDMGYWESTERYPDKNPEIWGSLCGQNIRHHKMPTEELDTILQLHSNDKIRILGVEFSNIERPVDNDGNVITNIIGYEILRGSREGAKSILAKGVFRNMRKYDIPDNTTSLQGLYPNYPYNDLTPDIYFHDGTKNDDHKTEGTHNLKNSIKEFKPLTGYAKDVFTFHSPELMFTKPYLNASEVRLYGEVFGQSEGYFTPSENHPEHKLIKDIAALVAGTIGVGYAIGKLLGTRELRLTGPGGINGVFKNIEGITSIAALFTGGASIGVGTALKALVSITSTAVNKNDTPESNIPGPLKIIFGLLMARHNIAIGGNEAIELMYNIASFNNYAFKHNSHGYLDSFRRISNNKIYRTTIDTQNYIGSSFQSLDGTYKINNLFRPKTVAVKTDSELPDPVNKDYSRYTIGGTIDAAGNVSNASFKDFERPTVKRVKPISMNYGALKFNFDNQYGQLEGIKQVPMNGSLTFINPESLLPSSTGPIFSGDVYIGRFTEKVIMPIFTDFLMNQPDGYAHDYLKYVNIPYPRYWMDTNKYDAEDLANEIMTLSLAQTSQALPNDMFYLDRHPSKGSSGIIDIIRDTVQDLDPRDLKNDPGSAFIVKDSYMYTHVNGILDYYVESEINLAFRDWEDSRDKRHYDPDEYNDVNELLHAEIIKKGNFYKYDYSLSASRFVTNLTSFGNIQPRDYDPFVAENCYIKYNRRLLYSLQSQYESKKDFWRVFLPNNYKDLGTITSVKPISKNGAIIFYPTKSPQMFQGVDQLQTDLGTKITIGDGGLFSQPFQNIVNSELSHEYGSCESRNAITNTPYGLFFVSQAQGKIFKYDGKINSISNMGMKYWFDMYLPSFLLKEFPDLEDSLLVDNPVVGIGCQAIYDPNYELVYFTKRDFKVKPEFKNKISFDLTTDTFYYEGSVRIPIALTNKTYFDDASWTISFDPKANEGRGAWLSFHDWHPDHVMSSNKHFFTVKSGVANNPYCPPGYYFNDETKQCEKLIDESAPAIVTVEEVAAEITGGYNDIKMDVVIAVDTSSSDGPNGTIGVTERRVVQDFLNNKGIVDGLQNGNVQIGVVAWSGRLDQFSMNPGGYSMTNSISSGVVDTWLTNNWTSGSTDVYKALPFIQTVLNNKTGSKLGNRTADANFKQIILFVTNASSSAVSNPGCPYQSSILGGSANAYQYLQVVYCGASSSTPVNQTVISGISCNNPSYEYGAAGNSLTTIVDTVHDIVVQQKGFTDYVCNCPAGYKRVYPGTGANSNTYAYIGKGCNPEKPPICRKITCECPAPPLPSVQTTTKGDCPDVFLVGDPSYTGPQKPMRCFYYKLLQTEPNYNAGYIWRHNSRCDSFCNFYNVDYPWEVEYVDSTMDQVAILKSIEYQLETYVYKGDLINGCSDDRWHDLDYNFDEAVLHNSEQVSGLLKLNLSPKNDPYSILNYPKINAQSIDILYSKEEQKFRFNQFWDITNDRGEFSNFEQQIFNTKPNGYIRDLNINNLNYSKPADQRKKLRHYAQKVLLRKNRSENRKMLLKISNIKLNVSHR